MSKRLPLARYLSRNDSLVSGIRYLLAVFCHLAQDHVENPTVT
jgi:hypothetical protein